MGQSSSIWAVIKPVTFCNQRGCFN